MAHPTRGNVPMQIQLIPEWREMYKMWSVWIAAFVAVMPQLIELAVSMGIVKWELVPAQYDYAVKVVCFIWTAARLIKQQSIKGPQPETISAEA